MPQYFFNIFDGGEPPEPDLDGTDLLDVYVAQAEAVRMSGEIMRDLGAKFWGGGKWRLEVTDAASRKLFVIHFSAEEVP